MALTVTGFSATTFDYKAFQDTAVVNTMVGNVTGSAGNLYEIEVENGGNSVIYAKIYLRASVTTAEDPDIKLEIPANGGSGTVTEKLCIPGGLAFSELSYFVTTTSATSNSQAASGTTVKMYGVTS